jgi:hypothetical protein
MIFTVTEVVRGATRFENKIDGEMIKSGTIFMDVSLDKDGEGWGHRTEPRRCESLDVIDRIKSSPFPMLAEIRLEEKATKGKTQLVVMDVKPLKRVEENMPKASK